MILHLDMDAFFASVEQLDDPGLRGKPVIIGGDKRGVVSTASYEARRFGVHSAMPIATARRLCPNGIFIRGRHGRYSELSARIMEALRGFSPSVEPASIDEAYLDAGGLDRLFGPPEALARAVKAAVAQVTGGLTCSVGIAPVKFLAKICSEVNKPDGVFILAPEEADAFLLSLEVTRLPGVGRRMAASLAALGITHVAQLRALSRDFMERRYGKWGLVLHDRAHGIDPRPVTPEHEVKSEGAERTFARDVRDRGLLARALFAHAERVGTRLRRHGLAGRTVTLKIKFADFRQITRSRTLGGRTDATRTIFETARGLLDEEPLGQPVRLIGLSVSGFEQGAEQLLLPGAARGSAPHRPGNLPAPEEEARRRRLDRALDTLRGRFGKDAVQRGGIHGADLSGETQDPSPGGPRQPGGTPRPD
ncbi:MAG: DNA polymerase IV [Desulfovibrio sp.]|uniref:DNA polymerase IV n=1 Tax=Desulfovibrio sp. TaxID=885 RepID=UPI001A7167E5|nr:DNA polymerase IV [Desulfovibrio sp.]MBD5416490.1 DNA polymerase IV [Desulfovibrio sp.]